MYIIYIYIFIFSQYIFTLGKLERPSPFKTTEFLRITALYKELLIPAGGTLDLQGRSTSASQ